ncbi:tryptophan transporter [Tepidibacter thalassicus]|uniref:Tryptophan transporter TrpP n=1 Tax=Tepidibacter thalassicus DSM 15285 TaxID=1123350 RepID=A0A1M5Q1X7_9FIRM|nr:tryptophan transporter [Tepidibacter thalassicus]SHH07940.1 Tryptophan transporter TrpP [Tepidibacter thalassicus DSM 15285]
MNLRKNILTALLLAIGFILHQLIPGMIVGMKFDLMLSIMFVSILINSDFKNSILTAIIGGFITAMTTTFPGGQIPNIIDKFVTCILVFLMIKIVGKYKENQVFILAISFIGTIISGVVFLISALFIVGLPAPFNGLFLGIVLPTAITNVFMTIFIYNVVKVAIKLSGSKFIGN